MAKKTPKAKEPLSWGAPGALAVARNQADGDWAAGMFLYRIKFRWQMKKKLQRNGLEWVAMSRENWARESGLTFGEFKNRALPKLRKWPFVTIRSMKLKPDGPKLLWVHLDYHWLDLHTTPFDMHPLHTGMVGITGKEWTDYPYKHEKDWKPKKTASGKPKKGASGKPKQTSAGEPISGKTGAELLAVSKPAK